VSISSTSTGHPEEFCITGGLLVRPQGLGTQVTPGSLVISQGRIAAVYDTEAEPRSGMSVLDASGMIVIPGLVNAHIHSHGVLSKWIVDGMPLEMWSPYVAAGRSGLTPEEARCGALLAGIEALRGGVTTLLDHPVYDDACLDAAAEAYLELGIRAAIAPSVMDLPYHATIPSIDLPVPPSLQASLWTIPQPDPGALVELTRRCIQRWRGAGDRLTVLVGPSAPQRCSDELLRRLARLASDEGVPIQTHLLETRGQALLAAERYGGSLLRHLERIGVLDAMMSVAHAVWVTYDDVDLMRQRDVTVVHNPLSNLTLGSGLMPLVALRNGGVRLALGTDSPNSGGHHVLFESMRLAAALPRAVEPDAGRWPTAEETLVWATQGGARAAGLEGEVGALAPGYRADLVLLRRDTTALTPLNHAVRQLVFSERGASVDTVLVGGRVVVQGGKVLTVDEAAVLRDAERIAGEMRARTKSAFERAQSLEDYTRPAYEAVRRKPGVAPLWLQEAAERHR
jgi:guanine deaminase